ncbi:MAG: hypothetical protein QOK25_1788 [Thermoleophilaceae bacterium]|nr:hypothetical protein [Thermoleophilaceae bacterium]
MTVPASSHRSVGRAALAVAAAIAAWACSAGVAGASPPTPIPEGPGSPPQVFFGAPAVQHPVFAARPPRHPFMAPNDRSNLHNDGYQTDANVGPGPLGRSMQRLSTFQSADCASITFDSKGRVVTVCVGLGRPTLFMFDPKTLETLASMTLPPRQPDPQGRVFNDFAGGGYFYLDHQDRAVVLTNDKHLYVIKETPGPGFAIDRDYDLSGVIPLTDKGFSALPDWSGRYWFVTASGVVGTVEPASGAVHSMQLPGEDIQNSFAVDEDGGVYVVSNKALYRFDPGPAGEPKVTWREVYPNSGIHKPGQADVGSGTTPTVMDSGLVAITDNADPMDVLVYRRGRSVAGSRLVCKEPVFEQGASATDQSLVVAGRSIVTENNYGYSGPAATENGKTTSPGLERVDLNPGLNGCHTVWKSNEVAPTVVPKLSLANGLVYTYTKPASADGSDFWYLTALDFQSGRTVYSRLAGEGLGYNNNYAPISIDPDNGSVFVGVLGGLVLLRDVTPPPQAGARNNAKAKLSLDLRYRARQARHGQGRGQRRCATGRVLARVRGRDAYLISSVEFLLGHGRAHRDSNRPFAHRFSLRRVTHDRIYTIRARTHLADGRNRTLRRRVRACAARRSP